MASLTSRRRRAVTGRPPTARRAGWQRGSERVGMGNREPADMVAAGTYRKAGWGVVDVADEAFAPPRTSMALWWAGSRPLANPSYTPRPWTQLIVDPADACISLNLHSPPVAR